MYILRGMFWLAVVALLMPSGPRLDFSSIHSPVLSPTVQRVLADDWRQSFNARQDALERLRERYRVFLLARLSALRNELEVARADDHGLVAFADGAAPQPAAPPRRPEG